MKKLFFFILLAAISNSLFSQYSFSYFSNTPNVEEGASASTELSNGDFATIWLWRFSSDTVISDLAILSNQGELLQKYENPFDGFFTKIISTADGNIILAGVDYNDSLCIIKADEQANIFWQKKFFFGVCMNEPTEIIETNDGGFALSAIYSYTTCSMPAFNSILLKLDENGNQQWVQHYTDNTVSCEYKSFKQTLENDYICFGWSGNQYGWDIHWHLRKVDAQGNTLWINNFEELPFITMYGYGIELTDDGGSIVCGYDIDGKNNVEKIKTAKIDGEGNLLWYKNYDYIAGGDLTYITKIAGGYVVAFKELIKEPNWYHYLNLLAIDEEGNELWHQQRLLHFGYDLKTTKDTSILVTGYHEIIGDENDLFVLKLYKDQQCDIQPTINRQVSIYPNPVANILNINGMNLDNADIKIINLQGTVVYSGIFTEQIDVSFLYSGIYLLKIIKKNSSEIICKKFIKQ